MRLFICFLLVLASFRLMSQSTVTGRAIRILDGDTFEILVNQNAKYKVRLTDIDAPEKKQDFGNVARQKLASYIFGKEITVIYEKLDRNKRILGHVYYRNEYINIKMVADGFAWHFKKYSTDHQFAVAEQRARQQKKGLWIHPRPIPPWIYRSRK